MKALNLRIYFFILFHLIMIELVGQAVCYTCSRDSMIVQLQQTISGKKRMDLLIQIIDIAPTADSANNFINELIYLDKSHKTIDIAPYKKLFEANDLFKNKRYDSSLQAYQTSVELFDREKKQLSNLLLGFRNLFNLLNIQEGRRNYYQKKLDYYLLNGPLENSAACYHGLGGYYGYAADYNQAISYYLKASEVFKTFYPYWYYNEMGIIGVYYGEWGNLKKALQYLNYALPKMKALKAQSPLMEATDAYYQASLAEIKIKLGRYDEALGHAEDILASFGHDISNRFYSKGLLLKAQVLIYSANPREAFPYLSKAKHLVDSLFNGRMTTYNSIIENEFVLYQYFSAVKEYKSAEKYLLAANQRAVSETATKHRLKYLKELTGFYFRQNNLQASKKFYEEYLSLIETQDAEQSSSKVAQYEHEKKQQDQLQRINDLKKDQAIQHAAISKRNIILAISLIALIIISAALLFIFRQLQINRSTLRVLRETQIQLVHSEKMASLGELTAGIAHEIQNPLNFVNNFSDVNKELLSEMKEEMDKGNIEDAKEIANDVIHNEEKINHHGKRADAIVKGMLQHSTTSNGQRELTDINRLADEYVKLAYHGMRAKDKSFNANFQTDFDSTIGKINAVPQDIGRVILNLINNAFYTVNEKAKLSGNNYEPTVKLVTRKLKNKIEIRVEDNGNGIPQNVVDKIFQPFFTTKPTGQGTGLGLSLSYDIIKAHGGEIKVETKEGEGSKFIIYLPFNAF